MFGMLESPPPKSINAFRAPMKSNRHNSVVGNFDSGLHLKLPTQLVSNTQLSKGLRRHPLVVLNSISETQQNEEMEIQ